MLGVMTGASLAVAVIGHALAQARGLDAGRSAERLRPAPGRIPGAEGRGPG